LHTKHYGSYQNINLKSTMTEKEEEAVAGRFIFQCEENICLFLMRHYFYTGYFELKKNKK